MPTASWDAAGFQVRVSRAVLMMKIVSNTLPKQAILLLLIAGIVGVTQSCVPRPRYRAPLPSPSSSSSVRVPPAPPAPSVQEAARTPLPQEGKIKEQDLKTRGPILPPVPKETPKPPVITPESATAPLPDDSSLLAKITPATSPQRAASLRLTEEGRKLLEAGDPAKALSRLEKTIVIDSTNSYGYFYLAKTHYRLGRYKESLSFLDVAESRFSEEPFWLAEVYALRGENFRALGMIDKAEASYAEALRLNSGNHTANDAMAQLQGQSQAIPR
jgi:predicted negative regulator of RcsB-dependent stress response